MIYFVNDYSEGAHQRILDRLVQTNLEPQSGYGFDSYSESAKKKIRNACDAPKADVFFLSGGTQTNAVVISALLQSYEGVVSADSGHINAHEAGAIEYTGHKVMSLPSHLGKIDADELAAFLKTYAEDGNREHMVSPGMVYISHPTEYGTIYSKSELARLSEICRKYEIPLYMDGARLGTGLTAPGADLELADISRYCDAFYIGGTKNGALMGEAMVLVNPELHPHFFRVMKQKGSVLAKGFLLGVQFEVLFKDGLYWENACWANCMAAKLKNGLTEMGFEFFVDSPTNQIFPIIPNKLMPAMELLCKHEVWCKGENDCTVIRLVTSFATKEKDVDGFLAHIKTLLACLEEQEK